MKKEQFLQHLGNIEANQKLNIRPVPYKHEGSTFDQDGIRITGTTEFIDSVLSRLTDLLQYENGSTRLQCVYKESTDRATGAALDSYNCYIQVHRRGREAVMANAFFKR